MKRVIYGLALIGALSIGAAFGGFVGYHIRPIIKNINLNFYGSVKTENIEDEVSIDDTESKDNEIKYGNPIFNFIVDDFKFSQKKGVTTLEGKCNGSDCKVTLEKESYEDNEQMRVKVFQKRRDELFILANK